MKYPVMKKFRDKHSKVVYDKGDQYDTDDAERAAELQTLGFIDQPLGVEDKAVGEWPKSAGGGYWDLPNGERVRGKENALAALEALNASEGGDADGEETDGQQAE